ncbi:MAG: pilus assembly protein TadG-related protein, partial [Oscillospiraceae bacterium]|nr:pilus assembly protein TadG-related protein [Oscillospiraceae bacterium]
MKTKKRQNRERGAIAVITALSITFFIACAALAVDIGLQCYKGAKLQNAVDSAATAVAQQIGSVGSADEDVAYDYLAQNGFDKDSDQYQGKIKVTIEKKGQLDQSTTQDENDYITTGYYKITADVDQRSGFMSMMGIDYFHLKKTAYVKADAQYTDMPKALKYTLFADSTEGTDAMPAMQIDGRTKSTLNTVTSRFEGIINGTSILVGKIGHHIFGTDVNYNPLVNINLSEVITNGDVHSNSNITIGVQALNASRTKDYDVDANETNSSAAEESTTDKDEEADDYGQVTYTAGTSITFDNSLRETGTQSTHVYVQNQQYVEITGATLKVIKSLDATKSENEIRNDFETEMIKYLRTHGLSVNSDDYKNIIKNQKNNIYKESDGRILLKDQSSIVYNIDHQTANKYLQEVRDNDGNVTAIASASGVDVLTNGTDLLYKNVGDTANDFSYDANNVEVSSIGETTIKNRITVTGKQVNRSLITAKKYGRLDTDGVNNTTTGARFAITRTFLENSDYISAPNMKPYFVRAIRSSVKKATEVEGNKNTGTDNIKQAVEDAQSKLKTYLANFKKNLTDSTKNDEESTNTDLLFKYNKENKDSGLTENSDNKTYKGYDLYERDEDGNFTNQLRTPETYVDDYQNGTVNKQKSSVVVENYRKKNIDGKYSDSRVESFYKKNVDGKFGPAKIIEFFNENIDGKYASDKVSSAKADITEKESYSAHQVKTETHTFFGFAPDERSIFLAPKNVTMGYTTPGEKLEEKINMNTSGFDSIKTPISSTNVTINEPDISQKGIVDYTKAEPKVTVGSKEYKAEEIVSGTVDTAKVVTDRAAETTWKQGSNTLNDHNQYRWITEGGSTSGLAIGRSWWGLQDYSTYKLKHGHFDDGDRGLRMGKDEQLYLTDYYRHTDNKKMFFANSGNTFIIGGENKFTQDNVEYAYYSPKAAMEFKESGNTVVVNGNMSVSGLSFKKDTKNNVLIVNGDLNMSGEIVVESGAEYTIVVTGKITCK